MMEAFEDCGSFFSDNGGMVATWSPISICIPIVVDMLALAEGRGSGGTIMNSDLELGSLDSRCRRERSLWFDLEQGDITMVEDIWTGESRDVREGEETRVTRNRSSVTILVTDLTVMREGRLCLAGVDMRSMRDVRPTRGASGLTRDDLKVAGGEIRPGCVLEFEPDANGIRLRRPHHEDVRFNPSSARVLFRMHPQRVHDFLMDIARPRLRDIFGAGLRRNWAVPDELERSLGTLACSRVIVRENNWGRLRVDIRTRGGDAVTDLPFNDSLVRSYLESADGAYTSRKRLREVNRALNLGGYPIARVGLSRPFDPGGGENLRCWLQVNAIYPGEVPEALEFMQ